MKKLFVLLLMVSLVIVLPAKVKVGEEVVEKFTTAHPYKGGEILEQIFHWPEAGYIAIHFSQFNLAKGDYVEIANAEGTISYTYKEKGKSVKGGTEAISEFWATHIPGDTAVVTLYSKNKNGGFGFEVDKWVHGYPREQIEIAFFKMENGFEADAGIEAICGTNDKEWAQCYLGTDMYNNAKAVCRLLMNGSSACTGWLLGSEGHVMTNEHCIGSQSTADNTDFEFMAEASCTTNCSSWFACPGTVVADHGTVVQLDSALDYTLVMLPTNVSGTYGYLKMRDTLPTINERIYIPQHPSAYGKQIAVYSTDSHDESGFGEIYTTSATPCSGGPGDIGYYADTEGGSSGSPVIAFDDNLVVALHHCALCPNRGVPIPAIIADLGSNIPADAVEGGTPPEPGPPAAPSNLTGAKDKYSVALSWSDNSNDEDGFKVYKDGGLVATLGANTTSYEVTGLTRKVTYTFQVCAFNDLGTACSTTISVRTR
ncbi:MAG: trypsin-like peptidase domain-containing protein [Candidatus Aminicenantes bacterium]|nr:trypsin-like peptidase domain-containing protein [Candidatus Aminicenantes bacterium]